MVRHQPEQGARGWVEAGSLSLPCQYLMDQFCVKVYGDEAGHSGGYLKLITTSSRERKSSETGLPWLFSGGVLEDTCGGIRFDCVRGTCAWGMTLGAINPLCVGPLCAPYFYSWLTNTTRPGAPIPGAFFVSQHRSQAIPRSEHPLLSR